MSNDVIQTSESKQINIDSDPIQYPLAIKFTTSSTFTVVTASESEKIRVYNFDLQNGSYVLRKSSETLNFIWPSATDLVMGA